MKMAAEVVSYLPSGQSSDGGNIRIRKKRSGNNNIALL
jgi:hypothetical protein